MGHQVVAREILPDEVYQIRAQVCQWIAQSSPHVILITAAPVLVVAMAPFRRLGRFWTRNSGIWRAIPSAQLRRYWQLNRSVPSHGRVIEQYLCGSVARLDWGLPIGLRKDSARAIGFDTQALQFREFVAAR